MIQMGCELGTFNYKKSSIMRFLSLFPLPTSNSIISIFNRVVSFIHPKQVRYIQFQSKTLKHFPIAWYKLLAVKSRKIILTVLITATCKANSCKNVDSKEFDNFLLFLFFPSQEALSVSNWRLRHSIISITSHPRSLQVFSPSRPCERGCIYKSSNYFNFTLGWQDEFFKSVIPQNP